MDITYEGAENGWDKFFYRADGNRPVLEIIVNKADQIFVCAVSTEFGPVHLVETKGTVHRHTDEQLEAVGIDTEYICVGSVASYVVPRIATLMARVYCPQVKS